MSSSANNKPIKEYFLRNEKPRQEEMSRLFPNLEIIETSLDSYVLSPKEGVKKKRIHLFFEEDDLEITVLLSKEDITFWKKKIIHSYCEFVSIKDILINFLFCDIRKIPEIKKWYTKKIRNTF